MVATLVLTERPGAGKCGSGVGNEAYTAFLIRRHKIVQWRRVVKPTPQDERRPDRRAEPPAEEEALADRMRSVTRPAVTRLEPR